MPVAIGVFDAMDAALVLQKLVSLGCPPERLSVVTHEPSPRAPQGPADIGAYAVGLHLEQTRDLGRVLVSGRLSEALAEIGDLFAALLSHGLSVGEALAYADDVMNGATLVAAEVSDEVIVDAIVAMRSHAHGHASATIALLPSQEPSVSDDVAPDVESSGVRARSPSADKPN